MRDMKVCLPLSGVSVLAVLLCAGACSREPQPAQTASAAPRPTASVEATSPKPAPETQPTPVVVTKDPHDYGRTEPVRPDANPGVASVADALATGAHPERLSPVIAPKPFDRDAYLRDPAAYLSVVEPGRVFQVAQPDAAVPRIASMGPTHANLVQGGTAVLRVHAAADMPVSFTSFDLGRFQENQLTAITVAADANGVAQATFAAAAGTIGEVRILAACPVTSGQITFTMTIARE